MGYVQMLVLCGMWFAADRYVSKCRRRRRVERAALWLMIVVRCGPFALLASDPLMHPGNAVMISAVVGVMVGMCLAVWRVLVDADGRPDPIIEHVVARPLGKAVLRPRGDA